MMHVIGMGIIDRSIDEMPDGWKDFTLSPTVRWFSVERFDLIGSGATLTQDDLPPAPRILEPVTEELWTRVIGTDMPAPVAPEPVPVAAEPVPLKAPTGRYWIFKLPVMSGKTLHLKDYLKLLKRGAWFGQSKRDIQAGRVPTKGDGVIIRENCELKVDEEDELMHVIGMGIIDQSSEKEPEGWKDFTFSPAVRWFTVEQFDLIGSGAALTQDDLPPAPRILEPVTEELWTRVMGMDMPSSNTPPAPSEPIFTSLLKDSQARCWLFKLPFVWDKDLHLDTFIEEIEQDMWFGQTVRDVQGDRIPEKGDVVVIRENCDLAREEPDGNMHIIGLGIIDRSCEDMPEDWETNTDREAVRWFSVGKFSKIGNGKTVSQKDLSPAPRILEPITKKKLSELLS